MPSVNLSDQRCQLIERVFKELKHRRLYSRFNELPVEPKQLFQDLIPEKIHEAAKVLKNHNSEWLDKTTRLYVSDAELKIGVGMRMPLVEAPQWGWSIDWDDCLYLYTDYEHFSAMHEWFKNIRQTDRDANYASSVINNALYGCNTLNQLCAALPGIQPFLPQVLRDQVGSRYSRPPLMFSPKDHVPEVMQWYTAAHMLDPDLVNKYRIEVYTKD